MPLDPKDRKTQRRVEPEPDTEERKVEEADVESFPASDAPPSWAGTRDPDLPHPSEATESPLGPPPDSRPSQDQPPA